MRGFLGAQVELVGARCRDGRELFLERRRHFKLSRISSASVVGNLGCHGTQRINVDFLVAACRSDVKFEVHTKFREEPRFHAKKFKVGLRTTETRATRLHSASSFAFYLYLRPVVFVMKSDP
jgi:hypothetical protein